MKRNLKLEKLIPFILLVILLILPFILTTNYYKNLGVTVFMYCFFAVCWNWIGGLAGQFALGNSLYIGIGAYTYTLMALKGYTPFHAVPVAVFLSCVMALNVSDYPEHILLRLRWLFYSLRVI